MKTLSVRPPYAYFIIYGIPFGVAVDNGDGSQRIEDSGKVIIKDVENRPWPTSFRGRVRIHVSKREEPIEAVLEVTHYLWANGLIQAVPIEGSDCQQDALFITDRGRQALELDTEEVERARAIAVRLLQAIESDTDVLVMKADLLRRQA